MSAPSNISAKETTSLLAQNWTISKGSDVSKSQTAQWKGRKVSMEIPPALIIGCLALLALAIVLITVLAVQAHVAPSSHGRP